MAKMVTEEDIVSGLCALGVKKGMMLEVHCSLRSFGRVEGGAMTIIQALQHVVGTEGAIVMPSFKLSPDLPLNAADRDLGLTSKIKILANDDDKSAMGIVADTFRTLPDVVTGKGLFRVSAWGKNADKHAAGFRYLIDSGGSALLLGVDIYKLSAMHYVEGDLPEVIKDKFKPSVAAQKIYPQDEWFIEAWSPSVKPWYTIQDRAYQKGYIIERLIGGSKCRFFKVSDVIELYRKALQYEPLKLYGLE